MNGALTGCVDNSTGRPKRAYFCTPIYENQLILTLVSELSAHPLNFVYNLRFLNYI